MNINAQNIEINNNKELAPSANDKLIAAHKLLILQKLLRVFIPPIIAIFAIPAFNPLFDLIGFDYLNTEIIRFVFAIIWWITAIGLLFISLKNFKIPTKIHTLRQIENNNEKNLGADFLFQFEQFQGGNKIVWDLAKSKISNNFEALNIVPKITTADKIIIAFFILVLSSFSLNIPNNFNAFFPNIAPLMGDLPYEFNIIGKTNGENGPEETIFDASQKLINIAPNSSLEININGAKNPPILVNNGKKYYFAPKGDHQHYIKIDIEKNTNLKIQRFGTIKNLRVKIITPPQPKFLTRIQILPIGDGNVQLLFKAKNVENIKKANLVIEGLITEANNHQKAFIRSVHPINISQIKSQIPSQIMVDTADSALMGVKARAYIVLEDKYGKTTKSNIRKIVLEPKVFVDVTAQAFADLRLKLLRTTQIYKNPIPNGMYLFDEKSNGQIWLDTTQHIDFAPKTIKDVYLALESFLIAPNALGLNAKEELGLRLAYAQLSSAQNTNDAKNISALLFEIANSLEARAAHDTKTELSAAFERLKNAIQNGADDNEIAALREELNQAIDNHVRQLAEQNQESGDMEVEGGESFGQNAVNQAIDEAQSSAREGKTEDALSTLNELQQKLENMKMGGNGGGDDGFDVPNQNADSQPQDGESTAQDILNRQLDLMNQNNSETPINSLKNAQSELNDKLKEYSNGKNDENLNNAMAEMNNATAELNNNNKQSAQQNQARAIEALQQHIGQFDNQAQNNQDPLGRENSQSGVQNKNENVISRQTEQRRARNIQDRIENEINKPNKKEQDKNYLKDLLRRN